MKQVIQNVRTGATAVQTVPDPIANPGQVLVATAFSAISAGTERYIVELSRKSLVGKAMDRPDHVRRVMQKIRQEGLMSTVTQVFARLDDPMPLGYSASGVVIECGRGVQEFKPGDRVAAAGPHAGIVSVSRNLCARVPEGVPLDSAAYTGVASIALQGVRLTRTGLGDRVVVVGLGLLGQMCVSMLKAQGAAVFGCDIDPAKLELARSLGADGVGIGSPVEMVRAFAGSAGVDAVILTAATDSNGPIEFAAEVCRRKGRIVLVGVVGLTIPRDPFFKKELEFTVSSSLGPGRGDPVYEDKAIDYPIGYARWTAQRNMEAVLELMKAGKLPVERLTTHRFGIDNAAAAYDLITRRQEPFLGLVVEYPQTPQPRVRRLELRAAANAQDGVGVSMIGAGNFARLILLPALSKIGGIHWRGMCTAKGVTATHSGEKMGFEYATTDVDEILNDQSTSAVFVTTRHDLHADLVVRALRAGKHVFVEKPLCITTDELRVIDECVRELGDRCPILMVGFNRRFAPAARELQKFFSSVTPVSIHYRFSPGNIPADHWTQDEEVGGGRIVGEACHAIDFAVSIANSVPVKVYAESVSMTGGLETSDDRVSITIRHENGSLSNVFYQAGGDRAFPPERVEVFGGGRSAALDSWASLQLWSGNKSRTVAAHRDKGHSAECAAFITACREGGSWPIPWEHIYGTTWASLMAVHSLRSGDPVSYHEMIDGRAALTAECAE